MQDPEQIVPYQKPLSGAGWVFFEQSGAGSLTGQGNIQSIVSALQHTGDYVLNGSLPQVKRYLRRFHTINRKRKLMSDITKKEEELNALRCCCTRCCSHTECCVCSQGLEVLNQPSDAVLSPLLMGIACA
jgi:hypothetical protein